jgi:DNA-binding CsgD family transcriptional regulator
MHSLGKTASADHDQQSAGDRRLSSRVLSVTRRVSEIRNPEDMLELLNEAKAAFGAESAAFVSFVRDDDCAESFRFLLACDPVWCMEYQECAWYSCDPWLLHAQASAEPTCGSRIECRTQTQHETVALARKFGVVSAYVVPAPAAQGLSRLGVLMLGSSSQRHFERLDCAVFRVLTQGFAMELLRWWVQEVRRELIELNRLSVGDLALLEFERHGLGTKEIAQRLGLTTNAVNSKFQRLNMKFKTPNRRATARLATEYGLIE